MYYSAEVYGERLKNHMGGYKNLGILIIWGLFLTYLLLHIRVFQIKYMLPIRFRKQMGCCPFFSLSSTFCFFQSIINSYNFCSIKPLKYDIDTSLCEKTHFLQMCVCIFIYRLTHKHILQRSNHSTARRLHLDWEVGGNLPIWSL